MSRIIPPDENLLNAPNAEAPAQGITPNGERIPVVTSPRRLSIFYQSGDTSPTTPVLNQEVDIAQPIIEKLVEYTSERSQVNNIPITGLPVQKVGFPNIEDENQPKYIDTSRIPNANTEFNSKPTQFAVELVTPDPFGVNYKNDNAEGPRNFNLNFYQKQFINANNALGHGIIVDETLLATRGHNNVNKTITPQISQNKNDGRITLGSYFYKNIGNGVNYVSGSYVRTTGETQTDAPAMTIDQMKVIGLNLMFEAVQGDAGFDYTIREENAGSKIEAEARMAFPSPQRIGKRVSLNRFTPAYQIKKLTGVEQPENNNFFDTTKDVQTYGSFYNVYAQFDSLISLGQIALAVAMILAFVLLLNVLTALINLRKDPDPSAAKSFAYLDNNEKQRLLGASVLQNSGVYPLANIDGGDIISQFLGTQGIFSYTRHQTEDCLNAGIQEFFGFSFLFGGSLATTATAGQQAANASLKVLTESGRLNVILRELLRSGITLIEDTAVDFSGGVSIAGIGNLIRKIRDLKIVRFINVLLGIGDKIKFENDISIEAVTNINRNAFGGSLSLTGSNVSYVDSLPDNRSNAIAKSRTSAGGLIWNNSQAGMLSLPLVGSDVRGPNANAGIYNQTIAFSTIGKAPSGSVSRWQEMGLSSVERGIAVGNMSDFLGFDEEQALQNGRIPKSVVDDVENRLEADYMPFYIHDLRTNEILSFHAFLEDASEDFQIEYSAQDGYGRMDKVQIYKGTSRNISVNFKMIATNVNDHDLMWYKINKLAMMIYPQWTQGRKIEVGNLKFTQPFSQIPGATPVIRLRLGDLYKANYSKMAVARLFGITTNSEYNVNGSRGATQQRTPPAPQAGNPAQTSAQTYRTKANNMSNIAAGTYRLGLQNVQPASSTSERTRRSGSSVGTYALADVFSPNDKLVFNSIPNLDRYKLAGGATVGTIPTNRSNPYGRIIVRVDSVQTSGRDAGIRIVPEKYIFDAVAPGSSPADIRSRPSINIVTANGLEPTPILIKLNELNQTRNGMFDDDNTRALFASLASNEQSTQAQESGQATTPAAQEAALSSLTPNVFYDDTRNPIMKAFNSSGGKGLAGVITSFKVDYSEAKANWGTDGSELLRAPMFVTIQLQMAVIHDITPGLDANGIMNAPIWPVGKASNYFIQNPSDSSVQTQTPRAGQPATNQVGNIDKFAVDGTVPLYYNRKD